MGTLTTSELIDEVKKHLGDRSDLTDARVVRVLNLQQERLARSYDYREFRQLVTGTLSSSGTKANDKILTFASLGLSQAIRDIYSFRVLDESRSRKLVNYSPRIFDQTIPDIEFYDRNIPSVYVVWSDQFELWKIPDQDYEFEIRLTTWPTALSTGNLSAKSDFEEKDDLLITIATSYLYNSYGEYDRASHFFGIFRSMWEQSKIEDFDRPDRDIKPPAGEKQPVTSEEYWTNPFVRDVR